MASIMLSKEVFCSLIRETSIVHLACFIGAFMECPGLNNRAIRERMDQNTATDILSTPNRKNLLISVAEEMFQKIENGELHWADKENYLDKRIAVVFEGCRHDLLSPPYSYVKCKDEWGNMFSKIINQ